MVRKQIVNKNYRSPDNILPPVKPQDHIVDKAVSSITVTEGEVKKVEVADDIPRDMHTELVERNGEFVLVLKKKNPNFRLWWYPTVWMWSMNSTSDMLICRSLTFLVFIFHFMNNYILYKPISKLYWFRFGNVAETYMFLIFLKCNYIIYREFWNYFFVNFFKSC